VGRLDLNSSGLLLLTDSGELANRLMHPRYGLEREYLARVKGELNPGELARLRQGILLDGVPARFERIESHRQGEGANRWYRVVLQEGRNREVRRLFEALGHPVSRLSRVRYGPVELPLDLAAGKWRELAGKELNGLFRQ
jgi:23S rRNA pseudouridine2605 synthase